MQSKGKNASAIVRLHESWLSNSALQVLLHCRACLRAGAHCSAFFKLRNIPGIVMSCHSVIILGSTLKIRGSSVMGPSMINDGPFGYPQIRRPLNNFPTFLVHNFHIASI